VTGASRGLGAAIASRFAAAGADLLLVARSKDALVELQLELRRHHGREVHALCCDLASPDGPARIAAEAERLFPHLSVLVNNADSQGPIGPIWENNWEDWQRTLRINLLGPVDLSRRAIPLFKAQRGKIINISGGGASAPRARFSAYSTAKAGLVRFSETLAIEAAPLNVDVNCVAPGALSTEMTQNILDAGASGAGEREYAAAVSVARQSSDSPADRAAELCAFLASAAGDGITGRLISAVWDPWAELDRHRDELSSSDVYTLRRIVPEDRGLVWTKR
jgi:NAD(P)-dependent dehydrogenase (short-subunit alcohol dehydrogenase family)